MDDKEVFNEWLPIDQAKKRGTVISSLVVFNRKNDGRLKACIVACDDLDYQIPSLQQLLFSSHVYLFKSQI